MAGEMVGEDVGTDVEFASHGVHESCVSLLFWCVGQLHVEWLQDLVKGGRGIADDAGGVCVCVCVCVCDVHIKSLKTLVCVFGG